MKNLKSEILTLIKNYAGEGNDKFVDKLEALFKQQMKEERTKIIEIIQGLPAIDGEDDDILSGGIWIDRKEILKNIESL